MIRDGISYQDFLKIAGKQLINLQYNRFKSDVKSKFQTNFGYHHLMIVQIMHVKNLIIAIFLTFHLFELSCIF